MTIAPALVHESSFPAMGSTVHVVVVGGDRGMLADARRRIGRLERMWSRFRPDSELSRLNRDGAVLGSVETCALVERMLEAWRATGGRFDPSMATAMANFGYDRPFDRGLATDAILPPLPSEGCDDVVVEGSTGRISVPPGVALDPGGIGKGYAADLVAAELIGSGATGALVNIGGDLKVLGEPPVGAEWRVEIRDEAVSSGALRVLALPPDAAVATSTPLRRSWRRGRETVHHLLDPLTGAPMESPAHLVTVVAADAWWAEATTKQLIGVDPDVARCLVIAAAALMVTADGDVHLIGPMEDYLV